MPKPLGFLTYTLFLLKENDLLLFESWLKYMDPNSDDRVFYLY